MNQDELKLAEALFIDMVNGYSKLSMNDVEDMSVSALQMASMFYSKVVFAKAESLPTVYRLKGCRACHGSGGKKTDPCTACNGTGKTREK
jgi:DnaJ-class molecular chaperone